MRERLETPRLVGERIAPEHLEPLVALYGHPRVSEWLGGPGGERERLTAKLAHWRKSGLTYERMIEWAGRPHYRIRSGSSSEG